MEKLDHPNVVGLTSVKWDALLPRAGGEFNDGLPRVMLVEELAGGGELFAFLKHTQVSVRVC
jgi:hypothetical protein